MSLDKTFTTSLATGIGIQHRNNFYFPSVGCDFRNLPVTLQHLSKGRMKSTGRRLIFFVQLHFVTCITGMVPPIRFDEASWFCHPTAYFSKLETAWLELDISSNTTFNLNVSITHRGGTTKVHSKYNKNTWQHGASCPSDTSTITLAGSVDKPFDSNKYNRRAEVYFCKKKQLKVSAVITNMCCVQRLYIYIYIYTGPGVV